MNDHRTDWSDHRIDDLKESVEKLSSDSAEQHKALGLKIDKVADSIVADQKDRAGRFRTAVLSGGLAIFTFLLGIGYKLVGG